MAVYSGTGIGAVSDIGVFIGHLINIVGLFIIAIWVGKAICDTVRNEFNIILNGRPVSSLMHVRRNLAIYLLLGLEFIIAADIINTMIHFDLENLLLLGLLVIIRIVIGYVLEKEIQAYQKEHPEEILDEEWNPKTKRRRTVRKIAAHTK